MRRGLISRSRTELPDAVLDARLARLKTAMDDAHLDALVAYTNNTRPAAVSWLTGFVPYWSEALMVVAGRGHPVLVVALTFRVKPWIERTSRVGEVIHTPRIGLEAARWISAQKPGARVGAVDWDNLPAGIADDLTGGGRELAFSDASALFGRLRGKADPSEVAFAVNAAAIARQALSAPHEGDDIAAAIAAAEVEARRLGAEEVYLAAAPDLSLDQRLRRIEGSCDGGRRYALRASVAYKGTWVRLTRTIDRDNAPGPALQEAASRFAEAVACLPDDRGFAGFDAWLVEGCRLAQPLDALMGSRLAAPAAPGPGALVSVQATIGVDGRPFLFGAPALLGGPGEAASLLVAPL